MLSSYLYARVCIFKETVKKSDSLTTFKRQSYFFIFFYYKKVIWNF